MIKDNVYLVIKDFRYKMVFAKLAHFLIQTAKLPRMEFALNVTLAFSTTHTIKYVKGLILYAEQSTVMELA